LHPFYWTYGTDELIDELARVDEILNLSEDLQQPTDIPDHSDERLNLSEALQQPADMPGHFDERLSLSEVLQQPTDMPDHFGIDLF
jgi:hypothetical protein